MKEGTSAIRQGDVDTANAGGTAVAVAPAAVVVERRRTPRRPVDAPVVLRLADAANIAPVPARLVDLSAGGVGIRLQRPLSPGKQFTLEVPGMNVGGSTGNCGEGYALRYRVVRCKALGQGTFHVGAAFLRTPAPTAARASAANANANANANAAANANGKRA